jgi:DNA-binding XRE family transcriptional regulator
LDVTDKEILRIIGQNIQHARETANLTQECLAEMINIHWTTLSRIETGRHPFHVTSFVRIVKCLKTSSNRLLEGIPDENPYRLERIKKAKARKRKLPTKR